nr:MAG TPA: hypothetical protein [Caudoviricetes sp.]
MAMANPQTSGRKMKGGTDVGKYLTNKECTINGHKWNACNDRVNDLDDNGNARKVEAILRCSVCGDVFGQDIFTGKEVYVRNPNFDVRKPVVAYRIRDDSVVPDIRINGENADVVSYSYQYVTSGSDQPGINCFIASIYLDSESKEQSQPVMHTVSVDQCTGQVFYQ